MESLSRDRGKAFNYRERKHVKANKIAWETTETAGWETTNVSGLKKRLSYWINLPSYADRSLTRFFPFQHFNFDLKQQTTQSNASDPTSKGISIASILRFGRLLQNYQIKAPTQEGGAWEIFFKKDRDEAPYLLFQEPTQTAAIAKRDLFIEAIQAFDVNSRGFFIVEHL